MSVVHPHPLTPLPPAQDLETKKVLKALVPAHAELARLKMLTRQTPNSQLLANTMGLIEAKDSSEIENIITTHDELYKSTLDFSVSAQTKEVHQYAIALKLGFEAVKESGLITSRTVLNIQRCLEENNAGYRKLPGTVLRNARTQEVVYTPPQDSADIERLMANLERFINDEEMCAYDPLVKMAMMHYQFESIHPFYDGNGRTGRILNILYLIHSGLQDTPVLYLSRYITQNKAAYYAHLQAVREDASAWEDWLLYMITAVEKTARETTQLLLNMVELRQQFTAQLSPYKFYSDALLDHLFAHPYTKIEFVEEALQVSRVTAANYLNRLAKDKLLEKHSLGPANYYINRALLNLL